MNWLRASPTCIRDPQDTVRIQRIALGWYRVYRVVRNEWAMVREVIEREDAEAVRKAKGE